MFTEPPRAPGCYNPFHRSLGGPQTRSRYFENDEILLLVGIEPNVLSHLSVSLVAIAT